MSYRMIASVWMGSIKTNSTGSPTFFSSQHQFKHWTTRTNSGGGGGVGGDGIEKGLPYDSLAKLLKRQFFPEKHFCYT